MDFCLHGIPVWRCRIDDGEIAGTHQRELQGSRDGRGCKGEGIHIHAHHLHLLLGPDTEFLLFIHNEQAQIVKFDILAEQAMGSDEDVDLSILQVEQ